MSVNKEEYQSIISELNSKNVGLIAVSKTKSVENIRELYELGQKDFGENYVQELIDKQAALPKDICWHFIGHLQTNKVKFIAPFIHLIQSVDSLKLLQEINKQAKKNNRTINCLLQIHIAIEETKFGLDEEELNSTIQQFDNSTMKNISIKGLMGMASFTNDMNKLRNEFKYLKSLYNKFSILHSPFSILSMGMSSDYKIAIEEDSTMVRIGSLLFGARK
ncbi:MAG: YggS family pyridoxal phosphate-dependent enzyme [Chitinophagaceae bacterium]